MRLDDGTGWNFDLIQDICLEESVNVILNIIWPDTNDVDRLFWGGNKSGSFIVSNYYAINVHSPDLEQSFWKALWKSKMHEQLKIFI